MEEKMIKKIKFPPSPDEIVVKLKNLIKIIEKIQRDEKERDDITPAQARIIYPIVKYERGFTIQELADMGGVTKGLVSRTIALLESKGFVERDKKREEQDRNYNIILRWKGKLFAERKKSKMNEVLQGFDGQITHEDMENFVRVLDVFTEKTIIRNNQKI